MNMAPHGKEKRRMLALYQDLDARLQPAPRSKAHDRIHAFLMGFPALRSADGAVATMMVQDFVEAVEGMPIEAIHRACKGWNRRAFSWANYSFPPNPAEMNRAVSEMLIDAKVEHYALKLVTSAKPVDDGVAPAPTEEQRAACVADAEALIAQIKATNVVDTRDPREAFGEANRRFQAREDAVLAQHGFDVPRLGGMRMSAELADRLGMLEMPASAEEPGGDV